MRFAMESKIFVLVSFWFSFWFSKCYIIGIFSVIFSSFWFQSWFVSQLLLKINIRKWLRTERKSKLPITLNYLCLWSHSAMVCGCDWNQNNYILFWFRVSKHFCFPFDFQIVLVFFSNILVLVFFLAWVFLKSVLFFLDSLVEYSS